MRELTIGSRARPNAPVLASGLKFGGSAIFNSQGEINANSKKDVLAVLSALAKNPELNLASVVTESEMENYQQKQIEAANARAETLAAVIADKSLTVATEVGLEMANTIYDNVQHQGIMRKILMYQPLVQGQLPQIALNRRNVMAATLQGPTQARLQIVRDIWLWPAEVDVTFRLMIEGKRLNQSREDELQLRYNEGLESILIAEDRGWKRTTDLLIDREGMGTNVVSSTGLTPAAMKAGMTAITGNGMPVEKIVISGSLWGDVVLDTNFGVLIDPVSRLEILRTGRMGTMFGAEILTDASRDPRQKVLEPNEVYFASSPQFIGAYTDRGGPQILPLTAAETGIAGAGWHGVEYLSIGVYGARGQSRIRLV